jgi:2-methylcitrate dehydratase
MQRIELKADPRLNDLWPGAMSGSVTVTTDDGKRHESVCTHPPGHPRNRLTDRQVETKFLSYAREIVSDDHARAIISAIWDLDRTDDLSAFTSTLAFDPR